MPQANRKRLTFTVDQDVGDEDDHEFHQQRHRAYRAAREYVDASLRDSGRDPATVREQWPQAYAICVKRTYVRALCYNESDPGIGATTDEAPPEPRGEASPEHYGECPEPCTECDAYIARLTE